MSSEMLIYHGPDCADGFTAAWLFRKRFPGAVLIPAEYGDFPPAVTKETNLWIVDFSYPRSTMLRLSKMVADIRVFDHHQTAEANCKGLEFCTFNADRCGSRMLRDHFGDVDSPASRLVDYVDDHDRFVMRLPETVDARILIQATERTMSAWDELVEFFREPLSGLGKLDYVRGIKAFKAKQIQGCTAKACFVNFGLSQPSPATNVSEPTMVTDVCMALLAAHPKYPIAACWYDKNTNERSWALRSRKGSGVNVAAIAASFGGGGHENAAGFTAANGAVASVTP